ncbi:hypothetical protein [Sphingobium sp. AP50]|uniref:hypothetical protein n=1 Tax=Sphingobium sp. AP50 TaxID=1884369 RepID=UPI0011604A14|nr:hypothetical protein [Sphingobium sp. AP50]
MRGLNSAADELSAPKAIVTPDMFLNLAVIAEHAVGESVMGGLLDGRWPSLACANSVHCGAHESGLHG